MPLLLLHDTHTHRGRLLHPGCSHTSGCCDGSCSHAAQPGQSAMVGHQAWGGAMGSGTGVDQWCCPSSSSGGCLLIAPCTVLPHRPQELLAVPACSPVWVQQVGGVRCILEPSTALQGCRCLLSQLEIVL
jgi:hypothetical protein